METNHLRIKDASKFLGVKPSTLWLYARQGKIHPIKLSPRVTIFKLSDLQALIDGAS